MSSAWEMRKKNIARELAEVKLREADLLKKTAKLESEADVLRSELKAYQEREAENDQLRSELDQRCRGLDRERAEMAMMTTTAQSELIEASSRERNLLRTTVEQRVQHGNLANEEAQALARAVDAEAEVRRLQGVEEGMDRDIFELRSELQESNGETRSCAMALARLEKQYKDLYFDHENQTEALQSAVESAAAFSSRCESLEDELRGARAGFRLAEIPPPPPPPPPFAGFAAALTQALADDLAKRGEESGTLDEEDFKELQAVIEEAKERKAEHAKSEQVHDEEKEKEKEKGKETVASVSSACLDGVQAREPLPAVDGACDEESSKDRETQAEVQGQAVLSERAQEVPQSASADDPKEPWTDEPPAASDTSARGDKADQNVDEAAPGDEARRAKEDDCYQPSPPLRSNRPPPPPRSYRAHAEPRSRPRDDTAAAAAAATERRQANSRLAAVADEAPPIYPYHHPDAFLPDTHHTAVSSAAASRLHDRSNEATSCPPEGRREDTAMHYLQAVGHLERLPAARTKHSGCRQDYPRGGSTRGMRARLLHDVLTSRPGKGP